MSLTSTPAGTWIVHAQAQPRTPLTFSRMTDGAWTLTRDHKIIADSSSGSSAYFIMTDLAAYGGQYALSYSSGFQPAGFQYADGKTADSMTTTIDPTFLIVQGPPDVTGNQTTQRYVVTPDSK